LRKALVLGSGGIKIAEAAEFDYSGSQALKALREEGLETVLVNPNVATVQTSHRLADRVYMVPINEEFVAKVIEQERPDGLLVGFGGQTALTVGVNLHRSGILSQHGVQVLGTPIEGVEAALNRELFMKTMVRSCLPIPPSRSASTADEALDAAEHVGYPVIVRVSFNLGGRGTIVAENGEELRRWLSRAFAHSPANNILVEKYLRGWKEIEFEVIRDRLGNKVAVACLENVEPMGVHTGDSIVVAPSQTLTDREYQALRKASLEVAEAIGLVGECNVQLALHPEEEDYYVIETNPRMSRSSALASKATGYPLAYVAAKLALGYLLDELVNKVTGLTTSFFEPSLDYVVVKMPRWDLQKFWPIDDRLGSEMKSVGEVMAIGRNLEEAMQKAIRMLDIGELGLVGGHSYLTDDDVADVLSRLQPMRPYWPLDAAKAIRLGVSVEELSARTGVDRFFLRAIGNVVGLGEELTSLRSMSEHAQAETLTEAMKRGFNDEQIAKLSNMARPDVARLLRKYSISPCAKNIDTLAGEYPAKTNYLYLTYDGFEDEVKQSTRRRIVILGPGVFRIGVSVEFDWAVVGVADALRNRGVEVVVVNYNPETVSTDWDMVDRLYFEELQPTPIEHIVLKESAEGIVLSAAGQIGNNMAAELDSRGLRIAGTGSVSIDRAEDRSAFSRVVSELGLSQPPWARVSRLDDAVSFAESVGYPVIVRPSYILSGSSVKVIYAADDLERYLAQVLAASSKPIVISKFIEDAVEVEVDAVSDSRDVYAVMLEHIEPAGVHSGDSTVHTPTRCLDRSIRQKVLEAARLLAHEYRIRGAFNVQFLVKDSKLFVLELNLRCSRSMPLSTKSCGIDMMDLAAEVLVSSRLPQPDGAVEELPGVYVPETVSWTVKSPQFSWSVLRGCYPHLGPEMRSTGEVASHGEDFYEALLKSWLASQPNQLPSKGQPILIYPTSPRQVPYLSVASRELGQAGCVLLSLEESPLEGLGTIGKNEAIDLLRRRKIGLLMTSGHNPSLDYELRRSAADHNVPLVLDAKLSAELSKGMRKLADAEFRIEARELCEYWASSRLPKLVGLQKLLGTLKTEWTA